MKREILSLAGALLIAASASAQTDKPKPANPANPQNQPQTAPASKSGEMARSSMPSSHKVRDVLGAKVSNPAGEDLGKVEELVLDPNSGEISYAVLSFGGFLGMGDRLFAIPFHMLKAPAPVGDDSPAARFTLNIDKAKLEKAPGFPKDNWPDIQTPQWSSTVDTYYGSTRPQDGARAIDQNTSLRLTKASELIGQDIHNTTDDELGEIKDLVLDPQRARVNYFVLSSGGFLGMGDKLIAVPWEGLQVSLKDKKPRYVLSIAKERLQTAPQFDEKDWRRMSDPAWVQELYTYYGVRPYWSDTKPMEASSERRPQGSR